MAREHKNPDPEDRKVNADGSIHHTKHSYKDSPGHHRSHDRHPDGTKTGDHQTEHSTGRKYWVTDSADGKHKAGDVTDKKGNVERRAGDSTFAKWLESIDKDKDK